MASKVAPVDAFGVPATKAIKKTNQFHLEESERKQVNLVLRTFRCLIADLCEQFSRGHPGSAMGMAAIGVALWKYTMRYSPSNPNYFNRDRFVLSNGHTCLFQYAFLHLTGYSAMTMDQLKSYHSGRTDSVCPGHPEIEHDGIEVTTGPLGQGVANAVGLAMASKHLGAVYNRPGFPVVNNMTWCMIGDACLQEGVAMEAIQLAGHWKLNNLTIIYDNNQVSCDGSVDMTNTEDVNLKMRACGWHVISIEDGNYDVEGIVNALWQARASQDKPTFINIRTVIGIGSAVAGDAQAHGAAFGAADVANIKRIFGMDPNAHFAVSDEVYDFFRDMKEKGEKLENDWNLLVEEYSWDYPDISLEFKDRVAGNMTADWKALIPSKGDFPTAPTASRVSAGLVCNAIASKLATMMVGSADLSPSVCMLWDGAVNFQHPGLKTSCGLNGNYTGRYIHWGVREHAMVSISNGLAAFNKGSILPVTSSYLVFYMYADAGIRMAALQGLHQIHIATHDSIGTSDGGPTHQPIASAALYRAMPNFLYIRPCDSEETAGAFIVAMEAKSTPSMISLSRHELNQYPQYSSREGVQMGAYIFLEESNADVTLIGVGSEMCFAVGTAKILAERFNIKARIVSFPCQRLFEQQTLEYKRKVLQYQSNAPRVVIEAFTVNGWERYADAGFSMRTYGHSLPGKMAYKFFGFDENIIAPEVAKFVDNVRNKGMKSLREEFQDLNPISHRSHLPLSRL
ncbi:transketolase [Xylogone sp. PMI_703]|nr:transketolase [Xylogone sp. PMI_703]